MTIWDAANDAIYASDLAVDAVLTVSCGEMPYTIRVKDWTDGVQVGFQGVDFASLQPAIDVRVSELATNGIALADLRDASLTVNGRDWRVMSHLMIQTATGAEVRLWLEKAS